MRLGRSILNAFRHSVRLVPDNIRPQIPAVRLQRECDAPRDSDEVFFLQSVRNPVIAELDSSLCTAYFLRFTCIILPVFPAVPRITISQVQPQRPVIPQHPPHFPEHLDHLFNVFFRRRFKADLTGNAIVAKAPIRRRSNASMSDSIRQSTEGFDHVTLEYYVFHCSTTLPLSPPNNISDSFLQFFDPLFQALIFLLQFLVFFFEILNAVTHRLRPPLHTSVPIARPAREPSRLISHRSTLGRYIRQCAGLFDT